MFEIYRGVRGGVLIKIIIIIIVIIIIVIINSNHNSLRIKEGKRERERKKGKKGMKRSMFPLPPIHQRCCRNIRRSCCRFFGCCLGTSYQTAW